MDKEGLRKQIYDELHSQYESKLRDVKKQKSLVEEELESASEKWRSERRRLNSEIDRLETALADSRDARRKAPATKGTSGADAQESSKADVSAAADEKLKKASREWDTERSRLEGEIARLQNGVAELLERANNPLRAGQAAREQLELRLEEAVKMKRQAEDTLLESRAEWEKEKLKLAGDMIKLRRSTGTGKAPAKVDLPEEDRSKEKELEKQLEEARKEFSKAKEAHAAEVQKLTAQIASIREAAAKETADQIERDRKESTATRESLERDLQKARKEITGLKDAQSTDLERQTVHLQEAQKAQAKIRDLERRVEEAAKSSAAKDQTERLEKQLAEVSRAREQLESQVGSIRDAAAKEYAEHVERQRQEAAQARESLERDLQKAKKEIDLLKGAQSTEMERQAGHLEEAQRAQAKIRDLERRIAEAKSSNPKDQTAQLEKQLAESLSARQTLERDMKKAAEESAELTSRLKEAQTQIQHLERQLEETKDAVNAEVVEQLRRQYDERIQEMIKQKTQLSEQLHSASALLEAERSRFANAAATPKSSVEPAGGITIDEKAMDAEVARVEGLISQIAALIDDPSTELSTVIRKNVERAELDAYLKGILFSLGKGHAM